jgi:4-carboxymuconolactone decarboxylase
MYPDDIDPETGTRLPVPRRELLDPAGQALYDSVADTTKPGQRGMRGPSGIHLHSPRLALLLRPLSHYLRTQTTLSPRLREIAILATMRACDNEFEWVAHEKLALNEGVSPDVIDIIGHRKSTSGLAADDALVVDLCRAAFESRHVPPDLYARAVTLLGTQQLVDLSVLMGYYSMTAALLTIFDMQLDPGQERRLPIL